MRFCVVVMTAVLAMGASGFAQKGGGGGNSAKAEAKSEPKSTAPVRNVGPKASSGTSSSKELQKAEHTKVAKDHTKKTHARVVKADKESRNSNINFNGRGGKGSGLTTHSGGSLKGRL